MRFAELPLAGAFVIAPERHRDARGWFARTFCRDEFAAHGLDGDFVQCSVSFNARRGTLRGMHFQRPPHAETKLVRCTRGAVFDVAVDIRRNSPTFGRWFAVELTADNRRAFYIPAGFAHGFQTLADDSELFYQMSTFYEPNSARGIRWDDDDIAIAWPLAATMLSDRDRNFPLLRELASPELT